MHHLLIIQNIIMGVREEREACEKINSISYKLPKASIK